MNKIFQIGFNRCATNSIYALFNHFTKPSFKSIHWGEGLLAKSMYDNMLSNKNLLSNTSYEDYTVFTDMESFFVDQSGKEHWIFMYEHFDLLDKQYPNSKFILNTRNKNDWINSRLNHYVKYSIIDGISHIVKHPQKYSLHHQRFHGLDSVEKVIALWNREWDLHHMRVTSYFSNRPQDLLIYHINDHSVQDIKQFFSDIEFTIDHMPVWNKTQATA